MTATNSPATTTTASIKPFGDQARIGHATNCHTVLAKFYFTNPKHIPPGIPEVTRAESTAIDAAHIRFAYEIKQGQLAQPGRVREGRVDTGVQFINNLHNVHGGCLVRGLCNANIGYFVTHCHWFRLKSDTPQKSDKYVVVLCFSTDSEKKLETGRATLEARRALASTCWQWLHAYTNPNGVITLNFGGRMPDGKPKNTVVVRNGCLTAAQIIEPVTEEQEEG
ncbi:MAG: hypothetical protein AAB365_00250 [Patescibacteria group bacterium]